MDSTHGPQPEPTPAIEDANATVEQLHERAAADYAANAPLREALDKRCGGIQ